MEFSKGSLLTQTTAFSPSEGVLPIEERITGSHFRSLEELRLDISEIRTGKDGQDVNYRGKTTPSDKHTVPLGPCCPHLLYQGNFPKCSRDW